MQLRQGDSPDQRLASYPLYDPAFEHDACGVGLVVDVAGRASREIVERALGGLVNLTHRGGVGADARTGDGAGILTQIPHAFFATELTRLGYGEVQPGELGVAMVFLPSAVEAVGKELLVEAMRASGILVLGWRDVPVDPTVLGETAARTLPVIAQLLVRRPEGRAVDAFERDLLLARKAAERAAEAAGAAGFYVVSCSARTVIYKGFCLPEDLPAFYADLRDPSFTSAIALFHQRYSTNTLPTWAMAQPFRFIAHNGEINTVQGNRNWMMARDETGELAFADGVGGEALRPVVSLTGSDSLSLDNTLELLYHGGRSLPQSLMMLVPEPWEQLPDMPADLRAFYDFSAGLTEQWDGPAALAFSDGVRAGATLDRNGLRPLRYAITSDGLFIAGSEAGTVAVDQATVIEKGRLGPGQMILVDTERGVVLRNNELKAEVAAAKPYADWLAEGRIKLNVEPEPEEAPPAPMVLPTAPAAGDGSVRTPRMAAPVRAREDAGTIAVQRVFGYSAEDIRLIVQPMAGEGKEPTWSMGDDAPLAVLSDRVRPLSSYFRQRFAQVTNPAIDSLRERKVMALDAYLGPRQNILVEDPSQAKLVHLKSIVLSENELNALSDLNVDLPAVKLSTLFSVSEAAGVLATKLDSLIAEAEAAVRDGASLLILSDRGVGPGCAPMPMLLAVAAVHHHLIRQGLRLKTDIVVETGEVWDVHHLSTLIGYGASAVHPYLVLAAAGTLAGQRGYETLSATGLRKNYIKALENGFLKVSSKMGISTASGYRGAQIFETIGLSKTLVDQHFAGTPARLDGIGLAEIEADIRTRHTEAYAEEVNRLPDQGLIRFRKDGETHAWSPTIVKAIQEVSESGQKDVYDAYRALVKEQPLTAVRDLLTIKPAGESVPLAEVEPIEAIVRRFVVTAMSLGSLSPEAHRTLAIAMNRLGARSNSGEGGEDPHAYEEPGPDIFHNKVKQVASGRFGVTANYLVHAEELEIKISQGSKPGEGGQIPGHKVTTFIARLRYAVPGLPLISPPPHHDIYSIEDLAQLIYDLRQINPKAKIGVKLVSEAGVGTVAAGVAKARADYILISGHNGGTGASPLASIKHAGSPWELGLAETQQTLVMNGLRSRVRLRTDGGLKTPEDVIVATLLGAEEYGFGTSVLIAMGCDMARQCHLNTCPTGIATQKEELRAKYKGTPEMVMAYFLQLAEGIRETLAAMGARSLDELIGRSDLLAQKQLEGRAGLLDLSELLATPAAPEVRKKTVDIDHSRPTLDDRLLEEIAPTLDAGQAVTVEATIATPNRTTGAKIANAIAVRRARGQRVTSEVTCRFAGSAGQSFGAFIVSGMHLSLEGEANDYVGKGMSGGEIAIRPPQNAPFTTPQTIAGNTNLYGATGGSLFVAGKVGERFGVRNSGATAVVEGVGDHGCEYMTGGTVVILGPTGRNFGAGMTNGVVYVLDESGAFQGRVNDESVLLLPVHSGDDADLKSLIERHVALTGSRKGQSLLDTWSSALTKFWKVLPKEALTLAPAASEDEEKVAD